MKRQFLGSFATDAGFVLIGAAEAFRDDPQIGHKNPLTDWNVVCRSFATGLRHHPLGVSGIIYQGGGDGLYSVFAEQDEVGNPTRLVIGFA